MPSNPYLDELENSLPETKLDRDQVRKATTLLNKIDKLSGYQRRDLYPKVRAAILADVNERLGLKK